MKKFLMLFFILLLGTAGLYAQTLALDAAIRETGNRIQTELPANALAAIVYIDSPSEAMSDYITGELAAHFINGKKIRMISRDNINSIENEMNLQLSGNVSDATIQSVGNRLNAEFIIRGSFLEIAGSYRFSIQAVSAAAVVVSSVSFTVPNSPQIITLTAPDANGVRPGRRPGENQSGQYRIGNYGPGGGIVFHDKGRESGGWRYLEVAPVETVKSFIWEDAALYCAELNSGGFSDWYLPSIRELEDINKNLFSKGIGGFTAAVYWSSSGGAGGQNMISSFNFATGRAMSSYSLDTARVRAIRRFK